MRLSCLSPWYVFQSMGCRAFVRFCSSSSRDQECGGRPRVLSGKSLVEPAGRTSPVLTFAHVHLACNPLFFLHHTLSYYYHRVHLQLKGCDARHAFVHFVAYRVGCVFALVMSSLCGFAAPHSGGCESRSYRIVVLVHSSCIVGGIGVE